MRVLSVSHLFPNKINPGRGIFVKERVKGINELVELKAVAPVPYFPFIYKLQRYKNLDLVPFTEEYEGVEVYHPRYFFIPKIFKSYDGVFYRNSLRGFWENLNARFSADILDLHWIYPDCYGCLEFAKKFKKKIVATVRGNEAIYFYENTHIKNLVRSTLKEVDHIISVSSDLKDKLVDFYGISKSKISVIHNGIDSQKFFYIKKSAARKKLGLDLGKKYIISIGRLSSEKGLDHLIRAFASFPVDKNLELVLGGDGPRREDLEALSRECNVVDRVRFLGEVPHELTCLWYNSADLFCLPSLREGCPNVVIESLACGSPVVGTRVGAVPDLISSKELGLLVEPGDEMELSVALKNALETDWDRAQINDIGRRNQWSDVGGKVIDVFKMVL